MVEAAISTLADQQLSEVLRRIEARTPAPASGSAAAIVCATAAALVGMVAAYQRKPPAIPDAGERASGLRATALTLAQLDLASYEPVLAAARLPGSDPDRGLALATALAAAAGVPLQIAAVAAETAELAAALAAGAGSHALGDAATAATLAEAACSAAVLLVEVNLRGAREARDARGIGAARDTREARGARDARDAEWREVAASLERRAAAARADVLALARA